MNFKTAPKHLSSEAKTWWRLVVSTYEMDPSGSMLLRLALEAFDRMLQARQEIEQHGLIIEDSHNKQRRMNPALRVEREARMGMLQAWRMLNIDIQPPLAVGRPPGPRRVA